MDATLAADAGLETPPARWSGVDPMMPRPFSIKRVRKELADTFTLELEPADEGGPIRFQPGQFNMLYAYGVGEVPISISSDPDDPAVVAHTTRFVGSVTEALVHTRAGSLIGVRGPFGTHWPVEIAQGEDVVFVAGGIGLAPLRPAIYRVLSERHKYGNVVIFYGARTPEDLLFRKELQSWRSRFDINVHVTVDRATGRWNGRVGFVTQLIRGGGFDRHNSVAFICGPELMMRYSIQKLQEHGLGNDRIHISMERNMKCAIGFCGHCQFGSEFVCKDGPVYRFDAIEKFYPVWEL